MNADTVSIFFESAPAAFQTVVVATEDFVMSTCSFAIANTLPTTVSFTIDATTTQSVADSVNNCNVSTVAAVNNDDVSITTTSNTIFFANHSIQNL